MESPEVGREGTPPQPRARGVKALLSDQRVAFVGVGAINTVVGTVVFVGLQLSLGQVAHYLVVLLCAHVISVLIAFVLHRRLVFRVTGSVLRDLARFETVYLGALAVNLLALPLLVELAGLPVIASQLLIVFVTAMISFFGHKHFSFRRKEQP